MAVGTGIGTMLAPGIGSVIGGGIGWLVDRLGLSARNRKRAFVSFDYRHDVRLKNLFVGQARRSDSQWKIYDSSLLEAAPEADWEWHASSAIAESELVVVLLGPNTHRAPGVQKEVRMARLHGVPIVQIASRRNWTCKGVRNAGRRYLWNQRALADVFS